jgi:hypothetical protein
MLSEGRIYTRNCGREMNSMTIVILEHTMKAKIAFGERRTTSTSKANG